MFEHFHIHTIYEEIYAYNYNPKTKRIVAEVIGTFTQFPLKLAYAITIHKSQRLTLEKVIIDSSDGMFAHGQLYVALSR